MDFTTRFAHRTHTVLVATLLVGTLLGGILILPQVAASTTSGGCSPASGSGPFTCNATGTYTPASGVTCVSAAAWGAGGGGGNSGYNNGGGGGGAGGGYASSFVSVVPGTPYTAQVGLGGAGGVAGSGNVQNTGGTGGDSWFSTAGTVLAKGGLGGAGGAFTGTAAAGGPQGGNVGSTTAAGGSGGIGAAYNTAPKASGGGGGAAGPGGAGGSAAGATGGTGNAPGGNGAAGHSATYATGLTGVAPGGGGAGGLADNTNNVNYAGGAGANGRIVITEYLPGSSSTVVASPTGVPADGTTTSTITVTLMTPCGPAPGKVISLASSLGGVTITGPTPALTNAAGQTTFAVKSSTCGVSTFTATDVTDNIVLSQTPTVSFAATSGATPSDSTVVAAPVSVPADGVTTSSITVTLRTTGGCPVVGKTVSLSSSRGGADTLATVQGTTDSTGRAFFTIRSSDWTTMGGVSTLTATDVTDGFVLTQTPTVTWTVPVGGLSFMTQPQDTLTSIPFPYKVRVAVNNLANTAPFTGGPVLVRLEIASGTGTPGAKLLYGPGQNNQIAYAETYTTSDGTATGVPTGIAVFSETVTGMVNTLAIDRTGTGYRLRASLPAAASVTPVNTQPFNVGSYYAGAGAIPIPQMPWPEEGRTPAHNALTAGPADMTAPVQTTLTIPGVMAGDYVEASPLLLDLNADGAFDIVAATSFVAAQSDTQTHSIRVQAFCNNGAGVFAACLTQYVVPIEVVGLGLGQTERPLKGNVRLAAGDLNGDNYPEIVVYSNYFVEVAAPPPAGTFTFNNGRVTVLSVIGPNALEPIGACPTGATASPGCFQTNSAGQNYFVGLPITPVIGDVSGTGTKQVLLPVYSGGDGYLVAFHVTGSAIVQDYFEQVYATTPAAYWQPTAIALGELRSAHNGLEVVTSDNAIFTPTNPNNPILYNGLNLYLCKPTLTASNCAVAAGGERVSTAGLSAITGLSIADLNGDMRAEIVANGQQGQPSNSDTLIVAPGTCASLTGCALLSRQDGNLRNAPALADVNDDGRVDIVNVQHVDAVTNGGTVSVRALTTSVANEGTVANLNSPGGGLADVNRDGAPDFVVGGRSATGGASVAGLNVRVTSLGSPTAPTNAMTIVSVASQPRSPIALADLNRDCRPEIAFGTSAGTVVLLRGATATLPAGAAGTPQFDASNGGTNYNVLASWTGATAPNHNTAPGSGLQARLAWNRVASDGGLPVVSYNVYRGTTAGFTPAAANFVGVWPSGLPPTPLNPFVDNVADNLLNGVASPEGYNTYYYKVSAVTCLGEGPTTANAFAVEVQLPNNALDANALVTKGAAPAYAGGAGAMETTIRWNPAAMSGLARPNGCGPVDTPSASPQGTDGYNVYRKTGAGVYGSALNGATLITSTATGPAVSYAANAGPPGPATYPYVFADAGVPAGATYTYKINSKNCVGEKDPGVEVTVDLTYPTAPTGLTAKPYGDPAYSAAGTTVKRVLVEWGASTTTATCGWMEGYRIYRSTTSGFTPGAGNLVATVRPSLVPSWTRADPPSSPGGTLALSYTDDVSSTSIPPGATYYYKVSGVNCAGEGAASAQASAAIQVPTAPAAPSRTNSGTTVDLSWSAPPGGVPSPGNNANCNWIEGYGIYRSNDDVTYTRIAWVAGSPSWTSTPRAPPPTAPTTAPGTTYTDNAPGTGTVYYKVSAVNCVGEGPLSPRLVVVLNQPPVNRMNGLALAGTESVTVTEDTSFPFSGSAALSATDPDSVGTFSGSLSVSTGTLTASGTGISGSGTNAVTFSGTLAQWNAALATVAFMPAQHACGNAIATLTMVTGDGQASDSDPILIHGTCVNDAPVNVLPAAQLTLEDTPLNFDATVQVTDVDALTSDRMRVSLSVTSGALTLGSLTGVTFTGPSCAANVPVEGLPACTGDGTSDASMTFDASLSSVNGTLNGLTFVPAPDMCGTVTFTMETHDQGNRPSGNLVDSDIMTLTVNCANDAPVNTIPASAMTNEDTNLDFGNAFSVADVDNPSGNARVTLTSAGGTLTLSTTAGLSFSCLANDPLSGLPACLGDGTEDDVMTFRGTMANINAALNGLLFKPRPDQCDVNPYVIGMHTRDEGNSPTPNMADADNLMLTITCVNDAPVAANQNVVTAEDTAVGITLGATDADGDALTYIVVSGPANGGLTGSANNRLYTPALDYCGSDAFTFKANDGTVDSNTATVSITVTCGNDPPTFVAGPPISIQEDAGAQLVSRWASQISVDPLAAVTWTDDFEANSLGGAPAGWTTSGHTDVQVVVDPDTGTGKVVRLRGTPAGCWTTLLHRALQEPIGEGVSISARIRPSSNGLAGCHGAYAGSVSLHDSASWGPSGTGLFHAGTDGQSVGAVSPVGPLAMDAWHTVEVRVEVGPSMTTVAYVVDGTSYPAQYLPNTGFSPGLSFLTFMPLDYELFVDDVAVRPISPVDAPRLRFEASVQHPALLQTGPSVAMPGFSLGPFTSGGWGDLMFTAATDACGSTTLSVRLVNDMGTPGDASDDLASALQQRALQIQCLNDAPLASSATHATTEATLVATPLVATDVDGDSLTYVVVSNPSNGVLSGVAPNLSYTPNALFCASDSFTFKANDGTVDSNTATITINVGCGNHAPTANAQSVSTNEDTGVAITLTGSDVDGDTLTFAVVTQPSNGILTGTGASRNYLPNLDFCASDSFTFKVNDGMVDSAPATVSITVQCVNDAPVAFASSPTVLEDTPANLPLLASDVDGDVLTYAIVADPTNGGLSGTGASRTYTPNANFCGSDSFTFKANDGTVDSNTATVSITVTCANDAPTADPLSVNAVEDTPALVTFTGTDPEGDTLTYAVASNPTRGVLSGSGSARTYTPNANTCGTDSFTYTAHDGTATSGPATVSLTVACVNDRPVFTVGANPPAVAMNAGPQTVPGFLTAVDEGGDVDENGQTVTFEVMSNSNLALFAAGPTLARTPSATSGATAVLQYTPATGVTGTATVCIRAMDNGGTSNGGLPASHDAGPYPCFLVRVNPLALAADLAPSVVVYVGESTSVPVTVTGGTTPYGPCAWGGSGSPVLASVSCASALVTYNAVGTYTLTFQVTDADGSTANDAATVTVQPVNTPPSFDVGADQVVAEDSGPTLVAAWATNLSPGTSTVDPGQSLTFEVVSNTQPTLFAAGPAVSPSGDLSFTPAPNRNGVATIGVRLKDNGGTDHGGVDVSAPQLFTITVTPVNDAPVAFGDPTSGCYRAAVGVTLVVPSPGVLGNDVDIDGDVLVASLVAPVSGLTLQPSGGFNYLGSATGTVNFSTRATDPSGLDSNAAGACIQVVVNQPPVSIFSHATPIHQGDTVSFTDASTDDYGVVAWEWRFGDGESSHDQHAFHLYPKAGVYTVMLKVKDEFGAQHESSSLLHVLYPPEPPGSPAPEEPPVVPADPPIANLAAVVAVPESIGARSGERVTIDASGSFDPEGEPLQFTWVQVGGPPVGLEQARSAQPSFLVPVFESSERMRFRVDVHDGFHIAVAYVDVVVAVDPVVPERPQIIATERAGTLAVDLHARGVSPTWRWDFGDGSPTRLGADQRHVYAQAGTYIITLTASDGTQVQTSVDVGDVHASAPASGSPALTVWLLAAGVLVVLVGAAVAFYVRRPKQP